MRDKTHPRTPFSSNSSKKLLSHDSVQIKLMNEIACDDKKLIKFHVHTDTWCYAWFF